MGVNDDTLRELPGGPEAGRAARPARAGRGKRGGRGGSPAPGRPLEDPELYINRELSLLEFNRRVLAQARDLETPLLERLRFLSICSTNLDEFFEIRVSGLRQQLELEVAKPGPDGLSPLETLRRVGDVAHELVAEQYRVLREELLPALRAEGLHLMFRDEWTPRIRKWTKSYFLREVLPVLTPVGLDPAHPFPLIQNKSLNFVVTLQGKDAFGRSSRMAVVQAPRLLPRLIELPPEIADGEHQFVTLSSIMRAHAGELFPGMKVKGSYPFRVTRNSDLWIDEEEVDDLLRALKGQLPRRNYGEAVRLEVGDSCPEDVSNFLLEQFELQPGDLYRVDGPVNLHRLAMLYDLIDSPALKYPPFVPALPSGWSSAPDVFAAIREGDVLLHHPYDSFSPVVDLVRQAASDPDVLAIKLTLYRTGSTSTITDALIEASRNGKEVTTVVELRARFDEEANIDIATRLQDAGTRVVYGIVGYKAHAKMMLVVRREGDHVRRYVHLGTGNYHLKTARAYTDFGLLTCDEGLGEDVHNLFQQLTGLGKVGALNKLVQSPFKLHERILELIEQETRNAERGLPAAIRAKVNALIEPEVIRALYRASQAGVTIDLVVRGICSLRPGIPGVSDNIQVISSIGRFLEHSRVYHFRAGGEDVVYCSSADWMQRNLFHRVEAAFPIESKKAKKRILEEAFEVHLRDNTRTWELRGDGTYVRRTPDDADPFGAQAHLLATIASKS